MAHDLIVRGGRIVDGTGAEPFHGDIAIDGDTIAAVGEVDGSAAREIDAAGATVTPGFVDLHTHFDAQAGWDPLLTPVSWHGVTTALFGNCGVTFAPCKPADREFLAGMMETVEDIPKNAILTGLPWDWESYGQYLDLHREARPRHQHHGPRRPLRLALLRHGRARHRRGRERRRDSPDRRTRRAIGEGRRGGLFHQPPARPRAAGRPLHSRHLRPGRGARRHLPRRRPERRHPPERAQLQQARRGNGHPHQASARRRNASPVQRALQPRAGRNRHRL